MKKNRNRLISLLLVLGMALSLCTGALAAQLEAEAERSVVSSVSAEESSVPEETEAAGEEAAGEEPAAEGEADPGEAGEAEERDPADASSPETELPEESAAASGEPQAEEPEESGEPELEAQAGGSLNVVETIPLELEYDDHFTFSEVKEGYVVAQIQKKEVTSYQVSGGQKTDSKDQAVITLNSGSATDAVATGTGTAAVLMVKKAELDTAKRVLEGSSSVSVDAVQVDVKVSPAPLTIMLLGGQSNMEGWGSYPGSGSKSERNFQFPQHSIVCPEGEVYSTYAPGSTAWKYKRADSIGGYPSFKYAATKSNAANFVAESLTGEDNDWSMGGTRLDYPLNQLTGKGNGKTGPDSGLAWEWNRLTGDKVWTVNAAVGSSSIKQWVPGKDCFERGWRIYGYALRVYKAEIKAGHYTPSHQLFFWLQGEKDAQKGMSGTNYYNYFKLMRKYMLERLNDYYNPGFEQIGIITVRASKSASHYRDAKDLLLTAPRVVQSWMANTQNLKDVHIVSNANEQWVSNSGVTNYFQDAYGGRLSYPIHSGSLSLPTKVSQVHNDIHYLQIGHNENGITAARGMYEALNGITRARKVRWRSYYNKNLTGLNLSKGESAFVVPEVSPVSASKTVKWRLSDGLSYSGTSGKVKVTGSGRQEIQALDEDGNVISTLVVSTGKSLAAPTLKSASNVSGKKLKASWGAVSGAEGYQIQCSLKSDFSSSVKTLSVTGTSATLKGLKSNKTYYVRVRAWKSDEDGKIVSKWSGKKSVAIKK